MKLPIAVIISAVCGGLLSCEEKPPKVGADALVTVYEIDGATEVQGHWEHRITNRMAVPEPDANEVAKALSNAGKEPPALLDTLDLRCGVQVGSEAFVVTNLYERGLEMQHATIADGQMRLTGESRVLGKLPEIAKILESCVYKMLDDRSLKKNPKAESGPRE